MGAAISGLLGIILFIFVCKWLSGYFNYLSVYLNDKENRKRLQEKTLLESLAQIRDSVAQTEEEEKQETVERLLLANLKIMEKREIRNAMEEELGIK